MVATTQITGTDVFRWIADNIVSIVIVLGFFIEIAPIKINPISIILNIIYKPIKKYIEDIKLELKEDIDNVKKELKEDIDSLKQQQESNKDSVNKLIETLDMSEISRIRWEIIEFSNTIDNDQLHTRDEYRHIIDENEKYHNLIKKYNLTNGIIDEEFEKINDHYNSNKDCSSFRF